MLGQGIDVRTKWRQFASSLRALLTHRGIHAGWNEMERTENGLKVRASVIEIDVAKPALNDSTVDISVRYMQHTADGRSVLTNDGASTYQAVNDLIDQCEAAAKAATRDGEQRLDQERLDDDGGRSVAEAENK
jgi:hypothetical protein